MARAERPRGRATSRTCARLCTPVSSRRPARARRARETSGRNRSSRSCADEPGARARSRAGGGDTSHAARPSRHGLLPAPPSPRRDRAGASAAGRGSPPARTSFPRVAARAARGSSRPPVARATRYGTTSSRMPCAEAPRPRARMRRARLRPQPPPTPRRERGRLREGVLARRSARASRGRRPRPRGRRRRPSSCDLLRARAPQDPREEPRDVSTTPPRGAVTSRMTGATGSEARSGSPPCARIQRS